MEPVSIIAILWGIAQALAIINLAMLYYSRIVDFFRNRGKLKESDKDNIAFSLQDKLLAGNYKTVYGIFNKRTNEVLEAEKVSSKDIDGELRNVHAANELVLYN